MSQLMEMRRVRPVRRVQDGVVVDVEVSVSRWERVVLPADETVSPSRVAATYAPGAQGGEGSFRCADAEGVVFGWDD